MCFGKKLRVFLKRLILAAAVCRKLANRLQLKIASRWLLKSLCARVSCSTLFWSFTIKIKRSITGTFTTLSTRVYFDLKKSFIFDKNIKKTQMSSLTYIFVSQAFLCLSRRKQTSNVKVQDAASGAKIEFVQFLPLLTLANILHAQMIQKKERNAHFPSTETLKPWTERNIREKVIRRNYESRNERQLSLKLS